MKRNDKPSLWRDMAEIVVFFAVCALVIWLFLAAVRAVVGYFRDGGRASLESDTVNDEDGVGRVTTAYDVVSPYRGSTVAEEAKTALWVYTEGEGMPPEWYRPDEPMAVEWYAEDHFGEVNKMVDEDHNAEPGKMVERIDIGCPEYNVESTLWGWDGHMMTGAELDLFSRITYLEFNGVEPECMNAGIDSILNLWDSGYFGRTVFDTLSATAENGALVYTTYGYVWDWDYDYTVLEEIKALCLERFVEGPRYNCCFFQLCGFPEWAEPLFEIDSVYFSTFKEGTWN